MALSDAGFFFGEEGLGAEGFSITGFANSIPVSVFPLVATGFSWTTGYLGISFFLAGGAPRLTACADCFLLLLDTTTSCYLSGAISCEPITSICCIFFLGFSLFTGS